MVRSQPGPAWVVPVLFGALGVLWGIPYLLIKVAVGELEPAAMVLGRTATAAAVMVPLALWRGELVPVLRRWRPVVAFALVEITVPWLLLARAEVHLSSSLTGLLLAGVPVAGVVLGLVLRTSERLGPVALGGIAVGLVGVALLVGVDVGVLGGGGREQFVAVAEVGLVAVLYAVGPVIMVAAGGLVAEVARDRSLRLAPVDLAEAREMIAEVRVLAPLAGYRGRPKGDLDALADAIVALSQLADDPGVAEAEINPLMVRPVGGGVVAVDALVRRI